MTSFVTSVTVCDLWCCIWVI